MTGDDKLIHDIENLIKFYEGLSESNPQLKTYLNKLYQQLNDLKIKKVNGENKG